MILMEMIFVKDNRKEYSSSIGKLPFLFLETKKFAKLLCDGKSFDEILELSLKQNIFQLDKEDRRKMVPLIITKRLKNLDEDLINILANGDDDTAKLITFLSIIKTDRLFFEFMWEVFRDKYILKEPQMENKDFVLFFENKANQSEQINNWGQNYIKKFISTYKTILCQANLCKREKTHFKIIKPIIHEITLLYIKKNRENDIYCEAMLLELK